MPRVNIGLLSLNVVTEGPEAAPALVLAHPLGADLTVWDEIAPALAERFRLVRFDARGHGASDVPPGPYSLDDFGRDVVALLNALAIPRAHFIGLSMSGAIGQWLLIHAPEKLGRVVLANTASHFPTADSWNSRIRVARNEGMAGLAPVVAERWLTPAFRAREPERFAAIETMLRRSPAEGYAASCAALRDTDLRDALRAAPERPVLAIVGESDPSTPPALGEKLARALPGARLARLPGAHLTCVESKDGFLAAVSAFFG
jgi:3-oxoadipate enol-lactonase